MANPPTHVAISLLFRLAFRRRNTLYLVTAVGVVERREVWSLARVKACDAEPMIEGLGSKGWDGLRCLPGAHAF